MPVIKPKTSSLLPNQLRCVRGISCWNAQSLEGKFDKNHLTQQRASCTDCKTQWLRLVIQPLLIALRWRKRLVPAMPVKRLLFCPSRHLISQSAHHLPGWYYSTEWGQSARKRLTNGPKVETIFLQPLLECVSPTTTTTYRTEATSSRGCKKSR